MSWKPNRNDVSIGFNNNVKKWTSWDSKFWINTFCWQYYGLTPNK